MNVRKILVVTPGKTKNIRASQIDTQFALTHSEMVMTRLPTVCRDPQQHLRTQLQKRSTAWLKYASTTAKSSMQVSTTGVAVTKTRPAKCELGTTQPVGKRLKKSRLRKSNQRRTACTAEGNSSRNTPSNCVQICCGRWRSAAAAREVASSSRVGDAGLCTICKRAGRGARAPSGLGLGNLPPTRHSRACRPGSSPS